MFSLEMSKKKKHIWPRRDSNTQPSDLESDALPLRHGVIVKETGKFLCYNIAMNTIPRLRAQCLKFPFIDMYYIHEIYVCVQTALSRVHK